MAGDAERRERNERHRRALDLADRIDAFADDVKGWPTTAGKLREAAGSLRWQVRWETKHD